LFDCIQFRTVVFLVICVMNADLPALAAGPFDPLAGRWSGSGTIHSPTGAAERIRCNSTYQPQSASNLAIRIRCASDSYNFDLSGKMLATGSSLRGQWTENSRAISGELSGTVRGDHMQLHIDTGGFSASLGISTRGRQQSVSMDANGGGATVRGSLSMTRQ
jgi:hypothetical protein